MKTLSMTYIKESGTEGRKRDKLISFRINVSSNAGNLEAHSFDVI